ncbi:MAG: DUF3106 domain-containing protein [Rubrivivax sp.]
MTRRAALRHRLAAAFAFVACTALPATPALAGDGDWATLSATERSALAPLQPQWDRLDEASRARWLDVARRFGELSGDERARVQARMGAWSRLSPTARGQARLQFQEARRWTPEERQQRWEAYQSLDPQARRVLAERWKLDPSAPQPLRDSDAADGKRNWLEPSPPVRVAPTPSSPTSVRARSGATTRPLTHAGDVALPLQPQPGVPKIAATDAFVDPATLLPLRGPQGAAATPQPGTGTPALPPRRRSKDR